MYIKIPNIRGSLSSFQSFYMRILINILYSFLLILRIHQNFNLPFFSVILEISGLWMCNLIENFCLDLTFMLRKLVGGICQL